MQLHEKRYDACIGGFLFYDEREKEKKEKLIKCVRIFVGHIETNKNMFYTQIVFF